MHSSMTGDARAETMTVAERIELARLELETKKVELQTEQVGLEKKKFDLEMKMLDNRIARTEMVGKVLGPKVVNSTTGPASGA